MISAEAKSVETTDGPAMQPAEPLPVGWRVRYYSGRYEAIGPDEEWPEAPDPAA